MVTVFTAVYNRAKLIENLYDSLKKQSDKDFEWIIIDDGSTDDLQLNVKDWIKADNEFSIIYCYVKNGGKHRAINLGVKIAHSESFFIVDSDDFIPCDAIEFINQHFKEVENNNHFAGISGLKSSYIDYTIFGGEPNFKEYVDATNLERGKYDLVCDKAEIYKTSVLKKFPFPEYENENFLGEGIVWNRIAYEGLKIRWFNKKIYYCNYLKDGLTRNILDIMEKNPLGWAISIVEQKKYKYYSDDVLFTNMYKYFEIFHDTMTKDRMCELLEISDEIYDLLQKKWNECLACINTILVKNRITNMAIYGMGNYGNRVLRYFRKLKIEVRYCIDKNYSEINFKPTYSLEMELPQVDSVCIALKVIPIELTNAIKRKFPNTYIWKISDIDNQIW